GGVAEVGWIGAGASKASGSSTLASSRILAQPDGPSRASVAESVPPRRPNLHHETATPENGPPSGIGALDLLATRAQRPGREPVSAPQDGGMDGRFPTYASLAGRDAARPRTWNEAAPRRVPPRVPD